MTVDEHLVGGVPLASLVRDFHRPMVNFARSMVNSPAVAEEAVQEAWVEVMRSSGSFEGRSSVSTWLFGIVKTPPRGTGAARRGSASMRCWPPTTQTRWRAACTPVDTPMPGTGAPRRRDGSSPRS